METWIFGLSEMLQDQTMVHGRDTFVCVCMCFILYLHPCVCLIDCNCVCNRYYNAIQKKRINSQNHQT